jgi:hypothetical protein
MTVTKTGAYQGPFGTNGVVKRFDFSDFQVADPAHVRVTLNRVEVSPASYTVTVNPDGTGYVTFAAAPATGGQVRLFLNVPWTQDRAIDGQGPFYQKQFEDALDMATLRQIWLRSTALSSLRGPEGEPIAPMPDKAALKGAVLAFHHETGEPVAGPSIATLESVAAVSGYLAAIAGALPEILAAPAAAEAAAAAAEAAAGPTYPDVATGLAATPEGQGFAVNNGDGTVTVWLNDEGFAVKQRTLANAELLAQPSGASLIGTPDGTAQSVLNSLRSEIDSVESVVDDFTGPTGASLIGATGGVTVQDSLDAVAPAINLAVSSVSAGIDRYETVAVMNADTSKPAGRLAYVYANNGSASDPLNLVYQWTGTAWEEAPWYFDAVAGVVQPLVDEAQQAAVSAASMFESVNIFNPDAIIDGQAINVSGVISSASGWGASGDIPVEAGASYTISSSSPRYQYVRFSKADGTLSEVQGANIQTAAPFTVTAPANATSMIFVVYSPTRPAADWVMVNAGNGALPWEPFGLRLKEESLPHATALDLESLKDFDGRLSADVLHVDESVNLYNPATMRVADAYISTSNAIQTVLATEWAYARVPLADDVASVVVTSNTARRLGATFLNAESVPLAGAYVGTAPVPNTGLVISRPSGAAFFAFNVKSNTVPEPTEIMVNAGTEALPYEPARGPRLRIRADAIIGGDGPSIPKGRGRLVLNGLGAEAYVESNRSGRMIRNSFYPSLPVTLLAPNKFDLTGNSLDGVRFRTTSDDIAPDHMLNTTIGARHGYILGRCTAVGHGMTTDSQGSVWTVGGTERVIVQVVDADTLLIATRPHNGAPPTGTYTYVSGGGSTANIVVTASLSSQWYPPHKNYSLRCFVDGEEITVTEGASLEYDNNVLFVETCDIITRDKIVEWWIANGGASAGLIPVGSAAYRTVNAYRFDMDGQLVILRDWIILEDGTAISDIMGVQAQNAGTPLTYRIPGFATPILYDGEMLDYGRGVDSLRTLRAEGTPSISFDATNLQASGEYAHRMISEWSNKAFVVGLLPVGDAAYAVRRSQVSNMARQIRGSSTKDYGRLIDKGPFMAAAGDSFSMVGFRHILPRVAGKALVCPVRYSDQKAIVYIDWKEFTGLDQVEINCPDLIGRKITVLDSRNATLIGNGLATGSITSSVDAAADHAYLVLEFAA